MQPVNSSSNPSSFIEHIQHQADITYGVNLSNHGEPLCDGCHIPNECIAFIVLPLPLEPLPEFVFSQAPIRTHHLQYD